MTLPLRRMLGCQAHRCQEVCHRGPCQPCPRSPFLVKTCPCGQTPLAKLLELGYAERQSCSDPIPSCGKTCNKPLACGSSGKTRRTICVQVQSFPLLKRQLLSRTVGDTSKAQVRIKDLHKGCMNSTPHLRAALCSYVPLWLRWAGCPLITWLVI